MKRLAIVLLALPLVTAGSQDRPQPPGFSLPAAQEKPPAGRFHDVSMEYRLPKTYPRPKSEWREREKAFYASLLGNATYDILVVPFQVQNHALDRPIRSLMTAQLAFAIAAAQKGTVADPYVVARA